MPIEIEDPTEAKEPAPDQEEKKKKRKTRAAIEEDEFVGERPQLWPLIPAIPVVLAIALAALPERGDIDDVSAAQAECFKNTAAITAIKLAAAEREKLNEGDPVPAHYLNHMERYTNCPSGGKIDIGAIGQQVGCSYHGRREAHHGTSRHVR